MNPICRAIVRHVEEAIVGTDHGPHRLAERGIGLARPRSILARAVGGDASRAASELSESAGCRVPLEDHHGARLPRVVLGHQVRPAPVRAEGNVMPVPGVAYQPTRLCTGSWTGGARAIGGQTARRSAELGQRTRGLVAREDGESTLQRRAWIGVAPCVHVGAVRADDRALTLGQASRGRTRTGPFLARAVEREAAGRPCQLVQGSQRLGRRCRARRQERARKHCDDCPDTPSTDHHPPPLLSPNAQRPLPAEATLQQRVLPHKPSRAVRSSGVSGTRTGSG